jgi:ribosomal protein L31E
MRRSHIYVVHSGERWAVKLQGCNVVQVFDRKAQALRAANDVAEEIWSQDGVPTRVQVQVSSGRWEQAREFGEEPLPIANWV